MPTDIPSLTALAANGDANAQNELGVRYYSGQGVKKNFNEALKWFTKAAAQGFAKAQADLGSMYFIGKGVKQNNFIAYAWRNIAAFNGNEKAKKAKTLVTKKMTAG